MKTVLTFTAALGVFALSACNESPREEAADNIEANAEMRADNLEETAGDAATEGREDAFQNQADAVREAGDNAAEDLRTNDPDTNVANGM